MDEYDGWEESGGVGGSDVLGMDSKPVNCREDSSEKQESAYIQ